MRCRGRAAQVLEIEPDPAVALLPEHRITIAAAPAVSAGAHPHFDVQHEQASDDQGAQHAIELRHDETASSPEPWRSHDRTSATEPGYVPSRVPHRSDGRMIRVPM